MTLNRFWLEKAKRNRKRRFRPTHWLVTQYRVINKHQPDDRREVAVAHLRNDGTYAPQEVGAAFCVIMMQQTNADYVIEPTVWRENQVFNCVRCEAEFDNLTMLQSWQSYERLRLP